MLILMFTMVSTSMQWPFYIMSVKKRSLQRGQVRKETNVIGRLGFAVDKIADKPRSPAHRFYRANR